jgi:hypothetical protein
MIYIISKIHCQTSCKFATGFLPAATGRNVTDFSQKSLLVDACMPLEHFA